MTKSLLDVVAAASAGAAREYDPRDGACLAEVERLAGSLLDAASSLEALQELEDQLVARKEEVPRLVHLAAKLARSRAIVRAITEPLRISVVFAMYREHTRILPPDRHPHGEDFLVRKIAQLRWLCGEGGPVTCYQGWPAVEVPCS